MKQIGLNINDLYDLAMAGQVGESSLGFGFYGDPNAEMIITKAELDNRLADHMSSVLNIVISLIDANNEKLATELTK